MRDREPHLRLPDFLYVGAPKAGSSWTYEVLRGHPQIYVPPAKDIQFFDRNYHKGIEWYANFFASAAADSVAGELSHDYSLREEVADRIRQHVPNVKIIFCLREPAALTLSAYRYARYHSRMFDIGLCGYSALPVARAQIDYLRNLGFFFRRFDRNRIHVAFFDELESNPERFATDLYRFLGVAADHVSPVLSMKVNAAKSARLPVLANFAYSMAGCLRSIGLANLVGRVKANRGFERLLYRREDESRKPLSEEDIECLRQIRHHCRTDYAAIEDLLGRPLPQAWYENDCLFKPL